MYRNFCDINICVTDVNFNNVIILVRPHTPYRAECTGIIMSNKQAIHKTYFGALEKRETGDVWLAGASQQQPTV